MQFLSAGPVAEASRESQSVRDRRTRPKLSIGYSILRDALQTATGWDWETLNVCYAEVGDSGETAGLLLRGISAEQPLTLRQANEIYQQLFRARTTAKKRELLVDAFRTFQPLTIKYFIKVITRGLRIGLMAKMVEEAVRSACDVPPEAVRDANNRLGDLARVALAARHGELGSIEARLFHPMEFMLAKPLERLEDLACAGRLDHRRQIRRHSLAGTFRFRPRADLLARHGGSDRRFSGTDASACEHLPGNGLDRWRDSGLARWPRAQLQRAAAAPGAKERSRHVDGRSAGRLHGLRSAAAQWRVAVRCSR